MEDRTIGPTGEFSADGPISESDEGGLRFLVTNDQGRVVLDFGTAVHWIAMYPDEADELAQALTTAAQKLKA